MNPTNLSNLSDDALLTRLEHLCALERSTEVETILVLLEVEDRRLHLLDACSSLFDFCRRRLRLSEGAAFRRINAARLVRRFPSLLDRLAKGDINLSALVLLRDHLTEANVDDLVEAARGKSKLQIQELVARIAPRPDVPTRLRKLPQTNKPTRLAPAEPPAPEPLAEARYRFETTISRDERDRFEYARDLLRHVNPSGDRRVVFMEATEALIEKLEKRILGKLSPKHAKSTDESSSPRPIARATPRAAEKAQEDDAQRPAVDPQRELARVDRRAKTQQPATRPGARFHPNAAEQGRDASRLNAAGMRATFAGESGARRSKANGARHGP